jgi:hypothetical protein
MTNQLIAQKPQPQGLGPIIALLIVNIAGMSFDGINRNALYMHSTASTLRQKS